MTRRQADTMKRIMNRTYEVEVEVEVSANWDDEDDGCGSPSVSGNGMTGKHGDGFWEIDEKKLVTSEKDIIAQIEKQIDEDDFNSEISDESNDREDGDYD